MPALSQRLGLCCALLWIFNVTAAAPPVKKLVYQQAQEHHMHVVSVVEKKVVGRGRFQVSGRLQLKLEGEFDDFMVFLAAMRQKQWALGQRLQVTAGSPCRIIVELELWADCAQRFRSS